MFSISMVEAEMKVSVEQLSSLELREIKSFNLSCKAVVAKGFQNLEVVDGILAEECLELFKQL